MLLLMKSWIVLHINEIDLNTVATHFPTEEFEFNLTPNPVKGNVLYLEYPSTGERTFSYRLLDNNGILLQEIDYRIQFTYRKICQLPFITSWCMIKTDLLVSGDL
jgi:hypothetical protein